MYNIETLAKLTGVSRRTVRYYVQRELLPPPEGHNRGSYYTEKHLERLKKILGLAQSGVPLIKMKSLLDEEHGFVETETIQGTFKTSRWERIEILKGLELNFYPNLLSDDELEKIKDFISDIIDRRNHYVN